MWPLPPPQLWHLPLNLSIVSSSSDYLHTFNDRTWTCRSLAFVMSQRAPLSLGKVSVVPGYILKIFVFFLLFSLDRCTSLFKASSTLTWDVAQEAARVSKRLASTQTATPCASTCLWFCKSGAKIKVMSRWFGRRWLEQQLTIAKLSECPGSCCAAAAETTSSARSRLEWGEAFVKRSWLTSRSRVYRWNATSAKLHQFQNCIKYYVKRIKENQTPAVDWV